MSAPAPVRTTAPAKAATPSASGTRLLQRKCGCGSSNAGIGDECAACQSKRIQRKLAIGSTNDPLEAEADRVAEQVMSRPALAPGVSHAPVKIQRLSNAGGGGGEFAPPSVERVLASPGRPLEPSLRADMEGRFGHDFSAVRVHTGAEAEESAREVNARAYTVGPSIVFAAGALAPRLPAGQQLIAHELAHVVQQTQGQRRSLLPVVQRELSDEISIRNLPPPPVMLPTEDKLYYTNRRGGSGTAICRSGCHGSMETMQAVEVTRSNLIDWVADRIWDIYSRQERVWKLTYAGEHVKLRRLWTGEKQRWISTIKDAWFGYFFPGASASTHEHFANYINGSWNKVEQELDKRSLDLLTERILGALSSNVIPRGATLITDPSTIHQINETPYLGEARDGNSALRVNAIWMGKRAKSIHATPSGARILFEVVRYEGIYFDFAWRHCTDKGCYQLRQAIIYGNVAEGTAGIAEVGGFIKGVLQGLAAPVVGAVDLARNAVDMTTLLLAALGRASGLYEWHFTCVGSICQQYAECTNDTDDEGVRRRCRDELFVSALKSATVIVPLVEQGMECADGNKEACGELAASAMGFVRTGGWRRGGIRGRTSTPGMTPKELQKAMIREKLGRQSPNTPRLLPGLEKDGGTKAEFQPAVVKEAPKAVQNTRQRSRSDSKARHLKVLSEEAAQLLRDSADPKRIRYLESGAYDAGITTHVGNEKHNYLRRKGTDSWERCSGCDPVVVDRRVRRRVAREILRLRQQMRRLVCRVGSPGSPIEVRIFGDTDAFNASIGSGYHVYMYYGKDGRVVNHEYTGRSGSLAQGKPGKAEPKRIQAVEPGTSEKPFHNWVKRLLDSHMHADWIHDVTHVRVHYGLTHQEMLALEERAMGRRNIRRGDYTSAKRTAAGEPKGEGSLTSPHGDMIANSDSARTRPTATFQIRVFPR